jgi:parallel beta-helix repeat protein
MKIDKNKMRKLKASLANTALILSIFVVLFPLIMPTINASAQTRYVGGSGPGNYTSIEQGIEAANPGDTVFVYAGTYNETVTIDKTITLQGEDKDTTIIDAQGLGTVITISASWVNVTGFTIKNAKDGFYYGIDLFTINSNYNKVYNNIIKDNPRGIASIGLSAGSSRNEIIENEIIFNDYGIQITPYKGNYSHNWTIKGNQIEDNSNDGIYIEGVKDFEINADNSFNNNGNDGIEIGIQFYNEPSTDITVIGNNFFNNSENCIKVNASDSIFLAHNTINTATHGIYLDQSTNIEINDSTISNVVGSCIFAEDSDDNKIYDNPLIGYGLNGIYLLNSNSNIVSNSFIRNNTFGIELDNSNYNTINLNNKIINNFIDGIYLNGSSGSHENIINGNNISSNDNIGINISESNDNDIFNNDILFNEIYGISLENSKDNMIYNNNVNNNTIYGFYIEGDYRNIIAENNTFNGGSISYVYGENGTPTSLNNSIQNKVLTSGINVTNVGKISFIECSYFNVTNNTISNGTKGIFLYNSNNITLDNNIIYDIDEYGLFIEGDYRNNITNNTIVNGERVYYYYNQTGNESNPIEIEIPESEQPLNATKVSNVGKISVIDSKYMLIKNNNVSNGYFGILLYGSHELTLWNNTIIDSEDVGLYISMGYYHNIPDNNSVRGWDNEWENISYFRDKHNIIIENYSLTARKINNVGKLTFVNCTYITVNNNTLNSSVYDWDKGGWVGGYGIFLYSSNNFTIIENVLADNIYGVGLIKSEGNNITNCTFGNANGILFESSSHNNAYLNSFTNYVLGSAGILVSSSDNITISYNNLTSLNQVAAGIQFTESENISILQNTFRNKKVGILGSYSQAIIEDNFITNVTTGIRGLEGCDISTEIKNNIITNITGMGAIYLGVAGTSSPRIEGNTISNFYADGIDVYHHDSAPYIYNNTIYNGGLMGIQLEDSNATIDYNKISDVNQGINVNFQPETDPKETYSNPIIINNEIWDCTRKPVQNVWGDGILVSIYNRAYIFNNKIYNNSDYGIHARQYSVPYISNNNLSYNIIGIRLETNESNLNILNNTMIGNSLHGIYTQQSDYSLIIDNNTLIDNHDGIFATNSNVTITNNNIYSNQIGINVTDGSSLTINNNLINWSDQYGIFISESSSNNIINNNISDDTMGIYLYFSEENNLSDNNISESMHGVYLYNSTGNNIFNNTVFSNSKGIFLEQSGWNNVTGNNASANSNRGITLYTSDNNIISGNNASAISGPGIHLSFSDGNSVTNNVAFSNTLGGIVLTNSTGNNISENNVQNNIVGIDLSQSHGNSVLNNDVILNSYYGGIELVASNENKIGMNNITSNSYWGISLWSSSNNNKITNNNNLNNTGHGIFFSSSDNNTILDNDLYNNQIGVELNSVSDYNLIYHNNFNNTQVNASDFGSNNKWDNGLEGNWWADNPDLNDSDGDGICNLNYSGLGFTDNKPLANEDNDRVLVDDPWFWFIQSGVNFAEPGWTVYATSSTYFENVTINKTLTVIGEDRNTTTMDARGNESVVLVDNASYVNVSGFTVANGDNGFYLNNSNYCILDDNYITGDTYGINLTQSSNNDINDNIISYNDYGIHLDNSNNTHISENEIHDSIVGNSINFSYNITLEYNLITDNNHGNRMYNSSILIQYNNISGNNIGIADFEYSIGIIRNNTITNNNDTGILNIYNSNAIIDNNTISYNGNGIECIINSSAIITYNNITFNDNGTVSSSGSNATIHWNNIHNSTVWNITNSDSSIEINATNNYWGSDDPNVIAAGIDGNVKWDDYETAPIDEAGPD